MKRKSVTLIEFIVVIVIIGALASGFSWYFTKIIDMWNFNSFRSDIVGQVRLGLMRMSRDIRQATVLEVAAAGTFTFTSLNDNDDTIRIRYTVQGQDLLYELDNLPQDAPDGNFDSSNILLSEINNFAFSYFDSSGNTAASIPDIHVVDIGLTLQQDKENITINSKVFPRNLL